MSSLNSINVPKIYSRWYDGGNNWGDILNPVLIRHLSGQNPVQLMWPEKSPRWRRTRPGRFAHQVLRPIMDKLPAIRPPVHLVVGSTLQHSDRRSVVWGAGFIHEKASVTAPPRKVYAVRGPLSRKKLLELNIDCPKIYGDPALLFPLLYHPSTSCSSKSDLLGIVPHLSDRDNRLIRAWEAQPHVKIINIGAGINEVVDQLCSCSMVVSSSLHGLIAAGAYGIPNGWLVLSDGVIGEGFKFRDYFASIGLNKFPLFATDKTQADDLRAHASSLACTGEINLAKLLRACPFANVSKLDQLLWKLELTGGPIRPIY